MIVKRYGDMICGVFSAVIASLLFWGSTQIKGIDDSGLGADFMPRITAVALLILSLILIYRGVLTIKNTEGETEALEYQASYLGMMISFILMCLYATTLKSAGFIISSSIYLFLQILIVTKKSEIKPLKFAVITVLVVVPVTLFLLIYLESYYPKAYWDKEEYKWILV